MTKHDGYEVWTALMEDAVDRGEVKHYPPTTISGYTIPATYWTPGTPHPRTDLMRAQMVLAAACSCRGRLHAACVYPTIQRGEEPDMPEDWRDWVRS